MENSDAGAGETDTYVDEVYSKSAEEVAKENAEHREAVEFLFDATDEQDLGGLKGRKLAKFSPGRFMMFNHLRSGLGCNLIRYSIGDGGEFFPEAMRILFLCFHTPEELAVMDKNPNRMEAQVIAWADEVMSPADFADAELLALRIWNQCHAHVGKADEPEEDQEPGKRESVSLLRRWLQRMSHSLPASLGGQKNSSCGS